MRRPEPRSTGIVSAAFARERDALYAIGILEACAGRRVRSSMRLIRDERDVVAMVILDIETVTDADVERTLVVMRGAHGIRVPAPDGAAVAGRVA